MATTRPKEIFDAITSGHERYVLAETVVRLTEEFRDDCIPGVRTSEAFNLLLILRRMADVHMRNKEASAVGIERATGIPRATVCRKLKLLVEIGAVEQRGSRYVIRHEFLNSPHMIEGFNRRRDRYHRADKKMSTAANS